MLEILMLNKAHTLLHGTHNITGVKDILYRT